MNSKIDVSVVVPIFNEEESLPHLIKQLLQVMRSLEETFELVLVNDGSTDKSANVLRNLVDEVPELVNQEMLEWLNASK